MSTVLLLVGVAAVIGVFSYFTNAGLGDRRPGGRKADQDSGDETPPPSR